jgi:myo-inositol-1(or 4)-monophosphatase
VLVAGGGQDATVSLAGKSDWDIAAADLIVQEAGGLCTDADGRPFVYNGDSARHPSVLAATPALHGPLLDILKTR